MAQILKFPDSRLLKHPRRYKIVRYGDLRGRRPQRHPPLSRGKLGKPILAIEQVWVELHSDLLWRIEALYRNEARSEKYPHDVVLRSFSGAVRHVSEQSLRGNMRVWDDMPKILETLMAKFDESAVHDPRSPFRHLPPEIAKKAACTFFGIDRPGARVDHSARPPTSTDRIPQPVPTKGSVWMNESGFTLIVRKHSRHKGERLWFVLDFKNGWGVQEYVGSEWYQKYVRIG